MNLENTSKKITIVWAIDAYGDLDELVKKAARTIQTMVKNMGTDAPVVVRPVTILNWNTIENQEFDEATQTIGFADQLTMIRAHKRKARSALISLLESKGNLLSFCAPVILTPRTENSSNTVDTLIHFSKKQRASFIVVSSHARRGFSRAILGSFAEKLLERSPIPVLAVTKNTVVNDNENEPGGILFATDFSETSRKAFWKLLPFAQSLKKSVILFHHLKASSDPFYYTGMASPVGPWITNQDVIEVASLKAKELCELWVSDAEKFNIKIEISIDPRPDDTATAIRLAMANTGSFILALSAQTGPFLSIVLGSVSRSLLRTVSQPVWIFRDQGDLSETETLQPLPEKISYGA